MRSSLIYTTLICMIIGGVGGGLIPLLIPSALPFPLSLALGILYGLVFALLLAAHAVHPGSGLLWGMGYAVLVWLEVPTGLLPVLQNASSMGMLDEARAHFPELVAYMLFFGFPLGLIIGIWNNQGPSTREKMYFTFLRAIIVGGLAGLVGGWGFSVWVAQKNRFVLVAGIVNSHSSAIVISLHYVIAAIIGASFGALFQRDVRGSGSSVCWGLAYGLFWWFLGPLTVLPILLHHPIDWSNLYARTFFGS